ncbi:MAG: hypothetical protein ACOCRK_02270 [bacterium]
MSFFNDVDLMEYKYKLFEDRLKYEKIKEEQLKETKGYYEQIKASDKTNIIKYDNCRAAYEYINKLFPECDIKDITIFLTSDKLLKKMNIPAYGFYDIVNKYITISRNAKSDLKYINLNKDWHISVVLVHEMLHYCYYDIGLRGGNLHQQEEFAYGYSIGYMDDKLKYSDKEIINSSYLMGYYLSKNIKNAVQKIINKDLETLSQKQIQKFYIRNEKKIIRECKKISEKEIKDMMKKYRYKIKNNIIPHKKENDIEDNFMLNI